MVQNVPGTSGILDHGPECRANTPVLELPYMGKISFYSLSFIWQVEQNDPIMNLTYLTSAPIRSLARTANRQFGSKVFC